MASLEDVRRLALLLPDTVAGEKGFAFAATTAPVMVYFGKRRLRERCAPESPNDPQRTGAIAMSVQTYEAFTDADGSVRFADAVRLPAHTRVYVVVPEQTTIYSQIAPEIADLSATALRFPSIRITADGLAKRLVKTVVEDACAEL